MTVVAFTCCFNVLCYVYVADCVEKCFFLLRILLTCTALLKAHKRLEGVPRCACIRERGGVPIFPKGSPFSLLYMNVRGSPFSQRSPHSTGNMGPGVNTPSKPVISCYVQHPFTKGARIVLPLHA